MAHDKKLHLIAGAVIALVASYLLNDVCWGFAWAILAGVVKEVYDLYDYGGFDYKDMLATWLGGAIVVIITEAVK